MLRSKHILTRSLTVLAVASLTACYPAPQAVKEVLADKTAYSTSEFGTQKLDPSVFQTISQADRTGSRFRKLHFNINRTVTPTVNGTPFTYTVVATIDDLGHGFMRSTEDLSTNGILTNMTFALTYRNLLPLRMQVVPTSAEKTGNVIAVSKLSRFDTVVPGHDAVFDYTQIREIHDSTLIAPVANQATQLSMHCTPGPAVEAKTVNSGMTGTAHEFACTQLNANGVATAHGEVTYLEAYGVVVVLSMENEYGKVASTITSFSVESK